MVHAQGTAGSLRFAFWDHWVPGANGALQQLAQRWGERNRVNMTLDFINTTGNQLQLTIANSLGVPYGTYTHHAISMHVYERDWKKVEELVYPNTANKPNTPLGIDNGSWWSNQTTAMMLLDGQQSDSHEWWTNTLVNFL